MDDLDVKNTETLPVALVPTPASPIGGVDNVTLAITLAHARTASTTVQIDCGDHALLNSPSGSWPYQAPVPFGVTSTSIILSTNAVTTSTNVQIRGGGATANMANPANWTATTVLSIGPTPVGPRG